VARGTEIFPEDLEAAEVAQEVQVEEGDALLIRTGSRKQRLEQGPINVAESRPGLHPASLPWLCQRGVAVIAADASHDFAPNPCSKLGARFTGSG